MATFNTKKILYGSPSLIPTIAERIQEEFQNEGYEVAMDALSSGGYDISITKGGLFKAVLGMRTALKVTLIPQGDKINFDAGVGIFGKMIIPTLVMWYVAWPVLLTQIWGLIQQAKIDDKALEIAENIVYADGNINATNGVKYCTQCGRENPIDAKFCMHDGSPL